MLDALAGGQPLSAGALAARARIRPQTASAHLAKLTAGGLVACARAGRMRMYRLSGEPVARVLEAMSRIAPPARIASLHEADSAKALRFARTCYDHLAGRLGVALTDALVRLRWLRRSGGDFELTPAGARRLVRLGVKLALRTDLKVRGYTTGRASRRRFARACLDWSERRDHLAGSLGAAVAESLFERGWISRRRRDRGVTLTAEGKAALARCFGVRLDGAR